MENIELTEREMAIAKEAARIALQEMTDEFYRGVGKTVINRLLIVVGAIVVGIAYGKGWITFGVK
jgi:hypothetical protein